MIAASGCAVRPISISKEEECSCLSLDELDCTIYGPTDDGFSALRNGWNKLLRSARFNTIFLTH